jgi:hypothetical protein
MRVPLLVEARNPNDRLFVAALDGTYNDMRVDPPEHQSAIAKIVTQIDAADRPDIATNYVPGPATQSGLVRSLADGAVGFSVEARAERMYELCIRESARWLQENPRARISIAAVGFSRGAEEVALFTRLVHERGIQNPDGARYRRDVDGNVLHVSYSLPPLVPPGRTAQVALLFDPVATGHAEDLDRRLPPSVIAAFQVTAEDERRDQFVGSEHLEPGYSEGRRFLNVAVAGAHSNIGDAYARNGLGIRSSNLGVDFLNALSDAPFLAKRAEPIDPDLNVVHRSEHHRVFFTTFRTLDGTRNHREALVDPEHCKVGAIRDCWNKEPIDESLAARFDYRAVKIAPPPPLPPKPSVYLAPLKRSEVPAEETLFDALSRAAHARDGAAMRAVGREYLATPAGQDWLQLGREHNQRVAEQEPAVLQQAQEAVQQRARAMHP